MKYQEAWYSLQGVMKETDIERLSIVFTHTDAWDRPSRTYAFDFVRTGQEICEATDSRNIFRAGRLGQPVFAYLVLRLADLDLFDPDRPLRTYLPGPISGFPRYADLAEDRRTDLLTARMILTHRSGLANSRANRPDGKLVFERNPGWSFQYSEEAFGLLQFVPEQKFGRSLEDLVSNYVFDFLGLREMGYRLNDGLNARLAGQPTEAALQGSDVSRTFLTSARDFNRFIWTVIVSGGAFSNPYIGLPIHDSQIVVRTPSIFSPPQLSGRLDLPHRFGWTVGWGAYYLPDHKIKFLGEDRYGVECYATEITGLSGNMIAITMFSLGARSRPVTKPVLRVLIGEVNPPLDWLDFEKTESKD